MRSTWIKTEIEHLLEQKVQISFHVPYRRNLSVLGKAAEWPADEGKMWLV